VTTIASAYLAHDRVVIGCDLLLAVIVEPVTGQSAADVITAMTGASASAVVVTLDGDSTIATASASVTAATRTLTITMTDTVTSALTAQPGLWRVRITTADGLVWPVKMPPALIRALP
jgi:hypothetical protein